MKRTIATKMIVMSNELRTRGSMPGAIRSEIITRSSAWEAITTSTVGAIEAIVALEAGAAQEQRQKLRADRDRPQGDVLVGRMRAAALRAEAVEHRHAEGADEIGVRPAAAGLGLELQAERAAVLAGLREQPVAARGGLQRRPCPASA